VSYLGSMSTHLLFTCALLKSCRVLFWNYASYNFLIYFLAKSVWELFKLSKTTPTFTGDQPFRWMDFDCKQTIVGVHLPATIFLGDQSSFVVHFDCGCRFSINRLRFKFSGSHKSETWSYVLSISQVFVYTKSERAILSIQDYLFSLVSFIISIYTYFKNNSNKLVCYFRLGSLVRFLISCVLLTMESHLHHY
jgi:hypothetical protein